MTTTSSVLTNSTASSSAAGGGGVPEFPYQLVIVCIFTVAIASAYVVARSRASGKED